MNNEEQIIVMLTNLTATVSDMKQDFGQRLDRLESKVDAVDTRLTNVESIAQATHDNLAVLENENEQAHGAIFDKLDIIENKTDVLTEDVAAIKERLDTDELYIRVFDKKLRQA